MLRYVVVFRAAIFAVFTTHGAGAFHSPMRQHLGGSFTLVTTTNHRHWATNTEVLTSPATESLPNSKEEMSVFRAPEEENGGLYVALGSEAKAAFEGRDYVQVENISFASSADEVSALLDSPSKESMSDAERQELDIALAQALAERYKTEEERFEALQALVDGGACIKRTRSMMRAAADHYTGGKNLKVLLQLGGSVTDRDAYGSTALHIACVFCNADAVELLIENGADASAKDDDGLTPKDVFAKTVERNKEIAEEYGYGSEDDRVREERIQTVLDGC